MTPVTNVPRPLVRHFERAAWFVHLRVPMSRSTASTTLHGEFRLLADRLNRAARELVELNELLRTTLADLVESETLVEYHRRRLGAVSRKRGAHPGASPISKLRASDRD